MYCKISLDLNVKIYLWLYWNYLGTTWNLLPCILGVSENIILIIFPQSISKLIDEQGPVTNLALFSKDPQCPPDVTVSQYSSLFKPVKENKLLTNFHSHFFASSCLSYSNSDGHNTRNFFSWTTRNKMKPISFLSFYCSKQILISICNSHLFH